MASLDYVITSIFNDNGSASQINRDYYGERVTSPAITTKKYMEIPIYMDVFELPLLAFSAFRNMMKYHMECDSLVAQIYSCGRTSNYKSLEAVMKDSLSTNLSKHLIKVEVPNTHRVYYSTFGAVFDHNLKPIMMLSWIMERKISELGQTKFCYKRPLLRLSPTPCLCKEDTMQRFLANKLLTVVLGNTYMTPYFYDCGSFLEQHNSYSNRGTFKMKVEIDECPFILKDVETPSISTTNEQLLQLAVEHIEEALQ